MRDKKSVILPDDISVGAEKHETVLSPVISDLAASILLDPLQMGVRPPRRVGFVDAAAIKEKNPRHAKKS